MNPPRPTVAISTLLALVFGGLFAFSLLCATVGTPPFNHRLGWLVSIDHGELRVDHKTEWVGEGMLSVGWQPAADGVTLLPRFTGTAGGPGFAVPLWAPFVLFAFLAFSQARRSRTRRWARSVASGACATCEHTLRGLGADEDVSVTCPECGRVSTRRSPGPAPRQGLAPARG